MDQLTELKDEMEKIKARNRRVERDKAWETSWTRRISIFCITWVFIALVMVIVGIDSPFLSAVVPAIGFILSTLSLDFIKRKWLENRES